MLDKELGISLNIDVCYPGFESRFREIKTIIVTRCEQVMIPPRGTSHFMGNVKVTVTVTGAVSFLYISGCFVQDTMVKDEVIRVWGVRSTLCLKC